MARPIKVHWKTIVEWYSSMKVWNPNYSKAKCASALGLSRRTVCRALKRGVQEGLLPENTFGPPLFVKTAKGPSHDGEGFQWIFT